MSKLVWILLAVVAIVMTALVAKNRTAHEDLRPYLGKWTGGFFADPADKHKDLPGYLQIYATHQTFKMHLEAEQQEVDIDGTWSLNKKQVVLKPTQVKINDFGGANSRDPNLMYYPNPDVQDTYRKPIVLNPTADGKKLEGLLITMGPTEGEHKFDWGGSGR